MRMAVAAATSAVLPLPRLRPRPPPRRLSRCVGSLKSVSSSPFSTNGAPPEEEASPSAVAVDPLHVKEEGVAGDAWKEAIKPPAARRSRHNSSGAGTHFLLSLIAANAMRLVPFKAQLDYAMITPSAFIEKGSHTTSHYFQRLVLLDLDPATAKLAISILGPLLSAYGFLFIVRIVMSWYPKLPVGKFPYVVAYAPTEPLLILTRRLIPPLGGVDVTPVVWFGLISFLNEILVGPQGLLVLLSQQV
uniref:Putative membrane protein ylmG n=1 Tax=Anthurium amnicola TaxID=1678845 RepID=A0A1D1ZG36_9ARAE